MDVNLHEEPADEFARQIRAGGRKLPGTGFGAGFAWCWRPTSTHRAGKSCWGEAVMVNCNYLLDMLIGQVI